MQPFQHCLLSPQRIARFYTKIAVRALYDELSLYPKPGLVSFIDNGAHQDMNGLLFLRSLFSLRHYFFNISLHAALGDRPQQLVPWGLKAEQVMYQTTRGINTHRGAIFALGILCSTLSRLSMQKREFTLNELQQAIINFWSDYLSTEHQNLNTHGTVVKYKYNVADAKEIAIQGYQLIFTIYKSLAHYQDDHILFGILAYQQLLLNLDDINILYRAGPKGLAFARQQISKGISASNREDSIDHMIHSHQLFSQHNISPGGVADMLSMLYFLVYLFKAKTQPTTNIIRNCQSMGIE
ncbi:triphosphoribosyl-dephospho-CoA synthase [Legionella beliardensis]|uniref:triphosphoribosyl-dephospho-CoA synthase n=1 Tax=Legionella beliardensis TaxID=91822 RepID=A0A378I511_9GAMM|nr:triphosphoribosyl-dephospho-CoA synthase [Legionella beliardensis]STX29761.1 triphosphoribosyl-dephospho-CoA synthase [Legionella beliardensis]